VVFEDKERAVEPRCAPDVLPVAAENPWNAPREESVVISMMGFTFTREIIGSIPIAPIIR